MLQIKLLSFTSNLQNIARHFLRKPIKNLNKRNFYSLYFLGS
ncbi:hypothetical protein JCM19240_2199 [Vibrio maritimus]|uniref:Uncharacterized protein n=1 Tax=Vibrio maritimus TaxID=990268 RepID=A0A090T2X6_9VIBR|nr:hypothetical protein JCM19240_2199 [Vibrio maritimus]